MDTSSKLICSGDRIVLPKRMCLTPKDLIILTKKTRLDIRNCENNLKMITFPLGCPLIVSVEITTVNVEPNKCLVSILIILILH